MDNQIEAILKGKKSYYNFARMFNSISNQYSDAFDYLHDFIIESLECDDNVHKIANRIRARANYSMINGENIRNNCFHYKRRKTKRVPGWNMKACNYFEKVNDILKHAGYPIGKHAKNGGEKRIGMYSVDFYIPHLDIVVEYNEAHHYANKKQISYDRNRRIYIQTCLNLPVIVVHEDVETPNKCAKMIMDTIKYSILKKRFENGTI